MSSCITTQDFGNYQILGILTQYYLQKNVFNNIGQLCKRRYKGFLAFSNIA